MIVKTLNEVPREILDETTIIHISYLNDYGYESSFEANSHSCISFTRKRDDNYRQWYKKTETVHGRDVTEEIVPVTESEMMKILKEKYNSYNRKYKYFVISFTDYRTLSDLCYVTPRPHPELCDSGISVINLNDDDAFKKIEKAVGGLHGRNTSAPSHRRAASKKRIPAVRVNVREMF